MINRNNPLFMQLVKTDAICPPFERLNYFDQAQSWRSKIETVRSAVYDLEVALVKNSQREAAIVHINKENMVAQVNALADRRLLFTPINWIKKHEGFSHRHHYTTSDDPEAVCYGVVTREKGVAEKFKEESLRHRVDHLRIGEWLGYPTCCTNFFTEMWSQGYIDPIWQQAVNTGGDVKQETHGGYSIEVEGYPECVAFHRYWGVRISFHLPCSFKCEATRVLAHKNLTVMKTLNPNAAQAVVEILSLPAIWDVHNGAAVVHTPHFKGMTNSVPCKEMHSVYFKLMCQ